MSWRRSLVVGGDPIGVLAILLGSLAAAGGGRMAVLSGPGVTTTTAASLRGTGSSGVIAIDHTALQRAALAVVHGEAVVLVSAGPPHA